MKTEESIIRTEELVNYRRYKDKVIISGLGMIIFGAWSVVKVYMIYFFNAEEYLSDLAELKSGDEKQIAFILLTVISIWIFCWHFYVGITAVQEALKPKGKVAYIIFGWLLFLFTLFSLPSYFTSRPASKMTDTIFASAFSDLILSVILGQLIYYSSAMKKIIKDGN